MRRHLADFIRDQDGGSAAEFSIVALLFFGMMLLIFDVSRAFWQHNNAMKACQAGVRFAVVNDMVPEDLATWDCVASTALIGGDRVGTGVLTADERCTAGGCAPAAWGYDSTAYDGILQEMGTIFSPLLTDPMAEVAVTYEHIGMGLCGNPFGPDVWPLVTVEISGIEFDWVTPLFGSFLDGVEFARCSASLTGEDFTNTCVVGGTPACP